MNKLKAGLILSIILMLSFCGKDKNATVPESQNLFFFKVHFVVGDVKIINSSGEVVANQGDSLKLNDTIVTGKKSVVDLIFGESGVIHITENSKLTVTSIADKSNNNTMMNMDNGKVFLTLSKLKGTGFKVQTPTVVASVRGTSFAVESGAKGSKLSVVKGTVAVNPVKEGKVIEEKSITVETGKRTDFINEQSVDKVIQGKADIPVKEMTKDEKIEIQNEVKDIKIDALKELSSEVKTEFQQYLLTMPGSADTNVSVSSGKEQEAELIKKAEEEKKKKEEELKKQEEELKKAAEEKKKKEEQVKKDRASNIPTM